MSCRQPISALPDAMHRRNRRWASAQVICEAAALWRRSAGAGGKHGRPPSRSRTRRDSIASSSNGGADSHSYRRKPVIFSTFGAKSYAAAWKASGDRRRRRLSVMGNINPAMARACRRRAGIDTMPVKSHEMPPPQKPRQRAPDVAAIRALSQAVDGYAPKALAPMRPDGHPGSRHGDKTVRRAR